LGLVKNVGHLSSVEQRGTHCCRAVPVVVIVSPEDIGEEKYLEYEKYNKQFYQYKQPQSASDRHRPEAVAVEAEDPHRQGCHRRYVGVVFFHNMPPEYANVAKLL